MKKISCSIILTFVIFFLFVQLGTLALASDGISISPASYNFFGVDVGGESDQQTFTVTNGSDADVVIDTVSIAGADASDFFVVGDDCLGQTIPPSGFCTVTLIFSPTSEGAKRAVLSVTFNTPDTAAVSASLNGTGLKTDSFPLPNFDAPFNASYSEAVTWYSLNLFAGQGVTVVLDTHLTSGYLDFGLFDVYGNEIAGSNDSKIYDGETGGAGRTVESSGVYYIKVWGSSDAVGNYDLAVYNAWFNPGATDSQRDCSSSRYTSCYIQDGTYSATELGTHWYRFTVQTGTQVDVSVTAHLGFGGLNFGIFTSDGRKIAASGDDNIANGQTGTATLSGAKVKGDVYYVKVWEHYDAGGTYDLSISGAELDSDTDSDGLYDAAEYYHGTELNNIDTDGDGVPDFDELVEGSDPTIATEYSSGDVSGAVDQAHAIPIPSLDEVISVEYPGTATWYAIDLTAGHGYTILLNAHLNSGALDFALYDENEVKIVGSSDTRINDGQLGIAEKTIGTTGTYFIKVWEYTGSGAVPVSGKFDLVVHNAWFNPGATDSQRDCSSSRYTSCYIQDGTYSATELGTHWYRFTVQTGTQVDVSVTAHLGFGGLNFGIFTSDGRKIAASGDDNIANGQTGTATLSGAKVKGDVYYVKVWEHYDAGGTYDLSISGAELDSDTDSDGLYDAAEYYHGTELNNIDTDGDGVPDFNELVGGSDPTIATEYSNGDVSGAVDQAHAILIPSLDEVISIEYPGTATWYAIDLTAGHGYTILLNAHLNSGELDFALYDENEVKIVGSSDTRIGDGQLGIAEKTIGTTGTYFIKVWEYAGSYAVPASGKFDLVVHNAWFNPGVTDSQRDYYSSRYTSCYIQDGTYSAIELGFHWYRFVVQTGTQVDVSVTAHLGFGGLDFGIFTSDGREIAGSSDGNITDSQTGTATLSGAKVKGDVYYVKVWEYHDAGGTYDLSITGADADTDSDSDGLFDAAEYYHGTELNNIDTDGDGVSDFDELVGGSDPTIAAEYSSTDVAGAVSQATAIPIPSLDEVISVEYPGTATWYAIDLTAGHGYTILLNAHLNSGELDFALYDENEVKIVGSSDTRIGDGQIGIAEKTIGTSGTYFIKVWEYTGYGAVPVSGKFDLVVHNAWFNPGVTDSHRDCSSSRYTSCYIQDGTYSATELGTHWYRFTVQTGTQVDVSVTAHLGFGGLDFGIFTSDGREIAGSSDGNITDSQTGTATLSGAKVKGDVYYVKVWEYHDAGGTYDLSITGADADTDSDSDGLFDAAEYYHGTELNNIDTDGDGVSDFDELVGGSDPTIAAEYSSTDVAGAVSQATAIPIPSLDEVISVEYPGTATWYAIDLTAGHGYTILLNAHLNSGELDFALYDENEVKIVGSSDTRIGDGQIGIAEKTIGTSGTYFIKVWEYTGYGAVPVSGKFDLVVHNAWFNPGAHDSQRNFYSTFYTSRYISNSSYYLSSYNEDYYRFTVQENTQIELSLTAHLYFGSLDFGIFNEDFVEIGGSNDAYIRDGETGAASVSITQSGTYYLKVWDRDSAIGLYDLAISGHNAISNIDVNISSFSFGNVAVGEYAEKIVTVSNQGEFDLILGEVTIEGNPDLALSSNHCSQNILSYLETCSFTVRFSPLNGGQKSAVVHIPSNDPDKPVFEISLTGIGIFEESDIDNDGMPNDWEEEHGLDPSDPLDAAGDPDSDGLENLDEYLNNTDPNDSDTDNDGISDGDEVNYGNDPLAFDSVDVINKSGDVIVSLTGDNRLFVEVFNRFCVPKAVQFELSGLDQSWYSVEPDDQSFTLMPFGKKFVSIQLHLPDDCNIPTQTYPFSVQINWEHGGQSFSSSDTGNLFVTPNPNIYPLAIPKDTRLAGNTIFVVWKTDIPATSIIKYRKLGDEEYIEVPVATDELVHRVMLTDLDYFTYYEFYTESYSSCGGFTATDVSLTKTGKAIKFVDNVNEFWVDRDYNQLVTLSITNTDLIDHAYQLSVINDNDDIVVGFVGDGTSTREATLSPGESQDVELVIHAPDAQNTLYNIYLKMVSDEGKFDAFVDYSHAIVHVRPFVANLDIQPVESMPGMMTSRFRLINYGDTLSDIEVYVDEDSHRITTINPAINHYRLENGGFVEFDINAQEYATGTIYARSGEYVVSAPFEIGCPPGTNLKTYTVNDISIVAVIKDWYCTNKMKLELPFAIPRGFGHDDLAEAAIEVNFSLPMSYEKYDPHTVKISINGEQIASLEDTIPEGRYIWRFPTSLINLGIDAPAENRLTVEAEGITEGQYIVVTDFKIILNVDEMKIDLCVQPTIEELIILPEPETRILDIGPQKKYRPGDTVPIFLKLHNNDNRTHEGRLTILVENNSFHGEIPPFEIVRDIAIPPGAWIVPDILDENARAAFQYVIPDEADDIEYRLSVTFENSTMNKTYSILNRAGFWVRTPLIIVHGIMGSELYEMKSETEPKKVWSVAGIAASPCDNDLNYLQCEDKNGQSLDECEIRASKVIKNLIEIQFFGKYSFIVGDIFTGLENHLIKQKYKFHRTGSEDDMWFDPQNILINPDDSEDVFYFVYDWRLDNSVNAGKLGIFIDNLIEEIKVAEGTIYSKVNIIAHSMGGLVSKDLLAEYPSFDDKINKVIFVGTPNLGAVEPFSMMKHGLGAPRFGDIIAVDFTEDTARLIEALSIAKDSVSLPEITSAISGVISVYETSMGPDYCNDNLEYVKALLQLISVAQAVVNPPTAVLAVADIASELYHLYNLDKDLNGIRDSQLKKILRNMPSAYQLLPSAKYLSHYPGGYYKLDGMTLNSDSTPTMNEVLASFGDEAATLLSQAITLHSRIDELVLSDKSYAIVGCKKCTTSLIEEIEEPLTLKFVPGDGDETVPLQSALDINVHKKYAAQYAKHSNLPSQKGVRLLTRSLLKGYETEFQTSPFHPVAEYQEGFCGLPNGMRIVIQWPDWSWPDWTLGNWPKIRAPGGRVNIVTGNDIVVSILGSNYRIVNDGVEIFVPEGSVYTLQFHGVDREYLDIKFQLMTEGGVIKTYVFFDIPLGLGGNGEIDIDLTYMMTDPVLRLDQDGDGNFETTGIPPSYILDEEQSNDFIAPETTANITSTMGQDDWYTSNVSINLAATDNTGGSGILATRYRLQGDETFTNYSGPIQITEPGNYTLTYYSIDKNLNKETEKVLEFKIDNKTPQVLSVTDVGRFNLGTTSFSASLDVQVGTSGLQDIRYSLGTAPGSTDIVDWTSAGAVSEIQATELSLVESCTEQIYINVQVVNGAGLSSEIASSDGVVVLESGGDPDGDEYDNESEVTAGSNPCNELSIPKETIPQLKKGFNFLSIPADVEFQQDLKNWLPVLGDATEIEKVMVYDEANNKFITLIPEDGSNPSFMLHGGEGLIVYAKQDKEITFTSVLCSTLDLKSGFNLVGFACPANGYNSAYQLLNDLGSENVSSIQRYVPDKGAFETAGFDPNGRLVGIDFPIVSGEGYFIYRK